MKSMDIVYDAEEQGLADRSARIKRCESMSRSKIRRNLPRYLGVCLAICLSVFALSGCGETSGESAQGEVAKTAQEQGAQGESWEKTLGPVRAVVTLSNRTPILGEQIILTLTVESEPDVVVAMPDFGDQLGRFGIADYKATESVSSEGKNVYAQSYTLDLPMSGSLRTPSFLVEFTDNRADSENPGVIQELLTEEKTFEVGSVFGDGRVPEKLSPAIGKLPELVIAEDDGASWWIYALACAAVVGGIGGAIGARRRRKAPELPADEVALMALSSLEKRGLPSNQAGADRWYVELSSILRTYIEGRFGLDAPRLTTEEFFEQAKKRAELGDEEKRLIRKLLERSDRVKFTDFMPTTEEMEQMLSDSRRFVEETRAVLSEEAKKDA